MIGSHILKFTTNLSETTKMQLLKNPLHDGEKNAHTFRIKAVRDGVAVDLTGLTVTAYYNFSDNTLPLKDCHIVDGEAEVTLSGACYIPCAFDLLVMVGKGETQSCILWVHGTVRDSMNDTVYDPESVVPNLPELLGKIAAMEQATEKAEAAAEAADAVRAGIQDDLNEISAQIGSSDLTNLLYSESFATIQGTVKLATQEYSGLTEKSTARAALSAGRRYLVYYALVIGTQDSGWPAATSFVPYLRNTTTSSNVALDDNVHSATYGNSVAGDTLTFYGYCNPTSDIAAAGGWFVTFNGGTGEKYADWTVDKVYVLDVTGLTDTECAGLVNKLNDTAGISEKVELPTRIDKLEQKVAEIEQQFPEMDTDLLFWGDSLTAGAGGNGTTYPSVCATELGRNHINCGVGGESVNTIAARQGGNNIIIPAGAVNGTYAELHDVFGWTVAPLLQGHGANSGNRLIINGEVCTLSCAAGTGYTISGYTGAVIATPTLARFAGSDYTGKVVVIWVGTNGGAFPGLSAGVDIRIALINSMIRHIGHSNYVIMGLTVGDGNADFYINEENKMWAAYGNKYFPTRKLLVENGLAINGLVPTDDDTSAIEKGAVPAQLLSDTVHLNAYGYTAVGKMLADKIRALGM